MRVLITGGTGFIGRAVGAELAGREHQVLALARAAHGELPPGMEFRTGDISDPDSLHGALGGIDAVVHLVGIIKETPAQTFEQAHVQGTRNVLDAMNRAGTRRLAHMSALGVSAQGPSRYQTTKFEAEELVRGSGLDYTIFRPSVVFGKGDGFTQALIDLVRSPMVTPIAGSGKTRFAPVAVEDVAECFAGAIEDERHIGQTYDLCGPDVLTFEEMLDMVARAAGRVKPKVRLPLWAVRAAAGVLERVAPNPPVTTEQLKMLGQDSTCEHNAAREVFGLGLRRFEEALPGIVAASR